MARNRHKTKPKASDYSPNSIGGMVDVLKLKKAFHKALKNDTKIAQQSLSGKGEEEQGS